MPPGQHATLGASKSHRWMACPGSIRLEQLVPKDDGEPSPYALEGTWAHDLAEHCLREDQDAAAVTKTLPWDADRAEWPSDMAPAVQTYLDYVRSRPGELSIEQQFSLDDLDPPMPMYGTADAVKWEEETRTLEVIDYKHGQGVVVYAQDNSQLLYYALGAVLALRVRPERIITTIVQPRAYREEAIDSAEYTWDELVAFKDRLMEKAHEAASPDAPVGPVGDHCRWCPAKAVCPAQQANALETAQGEFDVAAPAAGQPPAPETLSMDQLIQVLDKAPIVEDWIKEVRAYAQAALERGEEVPGWKLVAKRAARKWADEAAMEEWLKKRYRVSDIYKKKLISPYQAEKLLKDRPRLEIPEDMIVSKSSGVNLVPEDNPKPAITAGTEFPLLQESN